MTALIDILPVDCGCGCSGDCGGSDGTLGSIGSPSSQQQGTHTGIIGGIEAGISAITHLFGGSHTPQCSPPAGCFNCKIEGQGGIAGCINNVTQQWIAAAQARDAGQMSDADLLAMTQQIIAGLGNASYFTPQSDSYLTEAKQVFTQRAADITARIQAGQTNGTTNGTTGTITTTATGQPAILGQPFSTWLLVGGVGLIAYGLLSKN